MLSKKRLFTSVSLFLTLFLLSCSDDELNSDPDKIVDPLIIGSWRHPSSPTGFSIAEDGTVTYLKINQHTGRFVSDIRFKDKIEATNGLFKFVESNNCYNELDSTYSLNNGELEIPISKGWQFPIAYLPLDVESYISHKREEGYIKAKIDLLETKFENSFYSFNAFDEFSDINMSTSTYSGTFIFGYDEPNIECYLPIQFHHYIMINTIEPVNGIGVYQLKWASVQILVQEESGVYNLTFDNPSYLNNGQLTVTNFYEDEGSKFVEGSFEFTLSIPEFNGNERTVRVTNGSCKIFENLK